MTSTTTPTNSPPPTWIYADNYAAIIAAWTAMDQSYGPTQSGMSLQWIDNASIGGHTHVAGGKFPVRTPPWTVPPDWQIAASIPGEMNGKFVVYQNQTTHQVMIVAMGTNGNSDAAGWLSNAESFGLQQWASSAVQDQVFAAVNSALEHVGGTQLIVAGDSKGGALAQFIVNTLEDDKVGVVAAGQNAAGGTAIGADPLANYSALAAISNANIALIARVAPGVQQELGAGWDPQSQLFSGIQAFYSAPLMQDGSATEAVSQLGGAYLDGNGNFYQDSAGVVQNAFDYKWNGNNPLATYTYLHRLGYSGYDALTASMGSFTTLTDRGATAKGSINIADLQTLGTDLASLGQGPTVTSAEAKLRLGTAAIAGLALSPVAAVESLVRGAPSKGAMATAAVVLLLPGVEEALLVASGIAVLAQNAPGFFQAVANLWNKVFSSSAANGAAGADHYVATVNGGGNGIVLTDSAGDDISSVMNGNTTTVTLDANETITATSTDDGTSLGTVTWSIGGPSGGPSPAAVPAGVGAASAQSSQSAVSEHGTETFNASGGSTSTYYYATGGYAKTIDDGQGNVTTDYYSAAGNLMSWNWVHADGTSGSGAAFNNGATLIPGSASIYDAPSSGFETTLNPDGSYALESWNPGDVTNTTNYDSNGNQTASGPGVNGSGQDYDSVDTTSTTTTSSTGTVIRVYDPHGTLESDSWTKTDGTSGTDTFHTSGAASGKTINADGSSDTYSLYTSGLGGSSPLFTASSLVSFFVAGSYDLTRDHFNSSGTLTGDQWQLADGTSGSDTFNADGSGSGTINHADGYTSTVTLDSSQDITIDTSAANGNKVSEDWWHADGTYGIKLFDADGTVQSFTYQVNGAVVETDYDSGGVVTYTGTDPAGAILDPDGSGFGKVLNSDGTYSVNYHDSNGDALIFKFDGSTLQATDHVGALKPVSGFTITLGSGQVVQSPYNDFTPVITQADGTTQLTEFANGNGVETGDTWTNSADGSYGYDSFNSDGSKDGADYSSTGSYNTYTDDGLGDKTTDYYDSTGTETSDAWVDSDGFSGSDAFNADGSVSGTTQNPDGTSDRYTDDGQGDYIDNSYDAAGAKVSDEWSNSAGSSGNDVFNADGSKSGYAVLSEGAYSTYSDDPTGSGLQQDYTASNTLVQEVQTFADGKGDSVAYTFDAFGNALSYSLTTATGIVESGSLVAVGVGRQSDLVSSTVDGDSISAAAAGGIIVAWGDNDTVNAGAGSAVVDAWGSNDSVLGGSGFDTLTALGVGTTLVGGLGNEAFYVTDGSDVVEGQAGAASNSLYTTASYTLPTNVDTLTLQGSANLSATGNSDAANLITANDLGNDVLNAGSGSDTLVSGSTGIDTLFGGSGADTFVINNAGDEIELPHGGSADVIESSVSFTLSQQVSSLVLTGSSDLTATDNYGHATVTGNAGNDTLIGGSGADTLVAGTGVDTLVTGTGRNTLVIDNVADVIEASPGAANDTVDSSVSYTLASQLNTLVLTGSGDVMGQGNADAANSITGNSGDDTLVAGSGSDTLVSGSGLDTLIAGTGHDLLEGNNASDTYVLNSGFGTTQVDLSSGGGTIQFGAGISVSDLSVSTVVDANGNLALRITDGSSVATIDDGMSGGLNAFDLPGDPLTFEFANGTRMNFGQFMAAAQVSDSTVAGANGNLVVSGDADASLAGGSGNDTILGTGAGDTLVAGTGDQVLYGFAPSDELAAGTGSDTLYGSGGNDTLAAGAGNTVIHAGPGYNSYVLTEGGLTTIYAGDPTGFQTLLLPEGMTAADFTALETPQGDLLLESTTGDTTAIIKGFYLNPGSDAWMLTDSSGNAELLSQWASASQQGSGGGVGGPPGTPFDPSAAYTREINALRQEYADTINGTLDAVGQREASIQDPDQPSPTTEYNFTGIATENLTVQNGDLDIGSSDSAVSQFIVTGETTITRTISVPVYGFEEEGGVRIFVPAGTVAEGYQEFYYEGGPILNPIYGNGDIFIGWDYVIPPTLVLVQTGTRLETEITPITEGYTTETQGFTVYNITGDGGNDNIVSSGPFVGTVQTGNGDVNVNLGIEDNIENSFFGYGSQTPVVQLGAFIQAGNGDDYIGGTGGADTVAAGLGSDNILVAEGSTVYVPMEDGSRDFINVINAPEYGGGPYPKNTLVLPSGVTPGDLQYTILPDPSGADGGSNSRILELTYGNSSVFLTYDSGPASVYLGPPYGSDTEDNDGINRFVFADGTVLTRAEVIALAQAQAGSSGSTAVVTSSVTGLPENSVVAASSLFSVADTNGVSQYQLTNNPASGSYFSLDGVTYVSGATLNLTPGQFSQLQYHTGAINSDDTLQVSVFDGKGWSAPDSIALPVPASGLGHLIQGSTGPDTLVGNYEDTLIGASGQDTFEYNLGSGGETISETAAVTSSSDNVLRFGAGITPDAITLSIGAGGALVAAIGSSGDSVTIEGFNPLDPLSSMPIQQFQFADGTTLSLAQLLSLVQPSNTFATNADGSSTFLQVNIPEDSLLYFAGIESASGLDSQDFYLNTDGSSDAVTYVGNADGSATQTSVVTAAGGGGATTYVSDYDSQGLQTSVFITNPDGSTQQSTFNSQNLVLTNDLTAADGSTDDTTITYAADGGSSSTEVVTPAGGSGATTTVVDYSAPGDLTSIDITKSDGSTDDTIFTNNADGSSSSTEVVTSAAGGVVSTTVAKFDCEGDPTTTDTTYANGSTDNTTYTFNADGSGSSTEVVTSAAGVVVTTTVTEFDSSNDTTSLDKTYANGSTDNTTFIYNADGSGSSTEVVTPADGSGVTTTVTDYNAAWQTTSVDITSPDGSTLDSTYAYNADGSYTQTLLGTPAGGGAVTTTVADYDSSGNQLSENAYTPSSTGSYTDNWQNQDGSYGGYWWNASTGEYQETWHDSNGASWTDDYQYAAGGSPGSSGVSFTETYTDSAGDQGVRQYNATTGITSVSWDSSTTGALTGTTTDSGFIGLQNDGELTNTQHDPSFFNPAVSPAFQSFLAGH
jgi:Ca2+-binding RTX toxin-like protein